MQPRYETLTVTSIIQFWFLIKFCFRK